MNITKMVLPKTAMQKAEKTTKELAGKIGQCIEQKVSQHADDVAKKAAKNHANRFRATLPETNINTVPVESYRANFGPFN